ncbi:MSMEG_0565 family glycosyltransferase, partial [filamentous cyanobacterium CCP5]
RQRIQAFVEFLVQEPRSFDIYHAQDCIGANALLELRHQGQIPHFVRTVHHVEAFQSSYLLDCQAKSIHKPDLCLCVSDRWQRVLKAAYDIDAPRVINGVNLQRFSPHCSGDETTLKQRYGITGHPLYLTVGGIEPRKNSIRLLEAFALVLAAHPQARLIIAGGATLFDYQSYRDRFFATAKDLSIRPHQLILPGVVPAADLPALYRCVDAFCFPSHTEGWGLVVMEAIASGLPVVVSEQPPFTEFLAPDQAFWAAPDSPDAIAQAMIQAAAPNSHEYVQRSREILPNYSWQQSAQIHEEWYFQLVRRASGQALTEH